MKLQITIEGRVYVVDVELMDEEAPAVDEVLPPPPVVQSPTLDADPNVCRSPVTGLVIAVNVEPGQSVEAGAVLLVLEAMKMETHLTAPRAVTVKAVHVKAGDPVKSNQVLTEFA